jgi:hypothetical protein
MVALAVVLHGKGRSWPRRFEQLQGLSNGSIAPVQAPAPSELCAAKHFVLNHKIVVERNDRELVRRGGLGRDQAANRSTVTPIRAKPVGGLAENTQIEINKFHIAAVRNLVGSTFLKVVKRVLEDLLHSKFRKALGQRVHSHHFMEIATQVRCQRDTSGLHHLKKGRVQWRPRMPHSPRAEVKGIRQRRSGAKDKARFHETSPPTIGASWAIKRSELGTLTSEGPLGHYQGGLRDLVARHRVRTTEFGDFRVIVTEVRAKPVYDRVTRRAVHPEVLRIVSTFVCYDLKHMMNL